ncbi:MAG: hypothetical protein LH618_15420 [Saprospiraceae bacterium]|nr:hypothetical protein [Saprospiraceae bacterium]
MDNLDDELRDLSPLLRDLKRQGEGLRTPDGYFDDLEARVFGRLDVHEPQIFASQPAYQPYNLVGKVVARVSWPVATRLVQRAMPLRRRIVPALTAMAAGLALITAAVWFFRSPAVVQLAPMLAQVTMPELSEDDIESYVLENVHEFDAAELATLPPVEVDDEVAPEEKTAPKTPQHRSKRQQALDDLRPEDLDNVLDGLSDEDLEKLL